MEKKYENLKPEISTTNKWKRTFNLIRQNSKTCYGNVPEEETVSNVEMFIPKLKEDTTSKFVKWETTVNKAHVHEISKMVHDANLELLKEKLKEEPSKFKIKQRWKFLSNKALSFDKYLNDDVDKLTINKSSKDDSSVKLELPGVKTEITSEARYKLTFQQQQQQQQQQSINGSPPKAFKHKSKWNNLIKKATSQDSLTTHDPPPPPPPSINKPNSSTEQTTFKSAYLNEKLALTPKTKWKSLIKTAKNQECNQQRRFSSLNESHYLPRCSSQSQTIEEGTLKKQINTITDRLQCKDKWQSLVNKAQTSQKALSACLTNLPK